MKTRSIFVFHIRRKMWTPEVLKGSKRFKTETEKRINQVATKTMIQIEHIALKSSNCWLAYLTTYYSYPYPVSSQRKKKSRFIFFLWSSMPWHLTERGLPSISTTLPSFLIFPQIWRQIFLRNFDSSELLY